MPFQKNVVVIPERNIPFRRLVRNERFGSFVAPKIAAAADLHGDRQFVPIERLSVLTGFGALVRGPCVFLRIVGIEVDQLQDEITVATGSRGEQLGGQHPGDREIVIEGGAHK
jgi:hypothetical protein